MEFDQITEMRRLLGIKISNQINSESNITGCLTGEVSDYLDSFDPHEEKLRAGFRQNREHLQW